MLKRERDPEVRILIAKQLQAATAAELLKIREEKEQYQREIDNMSRAWEKIQASRAAAAAKEKEAEEGKKKEGEKELKKGARSNASQ